MAATQKRRKKPASASTSTPKASELKSFHNGAGTFKGFRFSRFWWSGSGVRAGIAEAVKKKLRPVVSKVEPGLHTAARSDLVLPMYAPQDYADLDYLLSKYDAMLPEQESSAYVQITFTAPSRMPLHCFWELVRQFSRSFFCMGKEMAVLQVLHAPYLVGSGNPPHIHLLVLPRKLTIQGFEEIDKELPSDRGQLEVYQEWEKARKGLVWSWLAGTPEASSKQE